MLRASPDNIGIGRYFTLQLMKL